MPKRKIVEAPVVAAAEPKKARTASKPKAPAAKHKRATKQSPEETSVSPKVTVKTAPLAPVAATVQPSELPVAKAPAAKATVTKEQIAKLAYSYWEKRGFHGGSSEHDWLCAERELKVRA